jgi:aminoglycoside/choline kinase family phosphotransferase
MTGKERDCLEEVLTHLGFRPTALVQLAGDASLRRFFRVTLDQEDTVVATLGPTGSDDTVARDYRAQCWGWERRLPIPQPLAWQGRVTVSADLGSEDLEQALSVRGEPIVEKALETLFEFQRCPWHDAPNASFDATFFRSELAVFEERVLRGDGRGSAETRSFLDALARRLENHPYRLLHRDYHANNLFVVSGRVVAVDYQDMRGGPDTYDLVSLLRERALAAVGTDETQWREKAAALLEWEPGWRERYLECAAQRGLKVLGTFLRLEARGRPEYLDLLTPVRIKTMEALRSLGAPGELQEAVERLETGRGL